MISSYAAARSMGARDALGVPAAVLAAGMLGFGALAFESGLNLVLAVACTAGIWALPGQIVLIEMHVAGAPGSLTVLAVVPPLMRLGFVFLNPVYFVVLLVGEARLSSRAACSCRRCLSTGSARASWRCSRTT